MTDVTDASFVTDVVERSSVVPVVVDLWAPWCGPCKTLGPILDKVVAETNGLVELAKVNVDENPQVSQAFQVQGIPAVYAMVGGQVADHFVGAKGEADVRAFVQALIPEGAVPPVEADGGSDVGAAEAPAPGLPTDEAGLRALLEETPDHPEGVVILAALLAERGDGEEALALLERIPETADTRRVAAIARTGLASVDDISSRLEALLPQVKDNDDARQEYVDLLEIMGAADQRTADYRKKLTSYLY